MNPDVDPFEPWRPPPGDKGEGANPVPPEKPPEPWRPDPPPGYGPVPPPDTGPADRDWPPWRPPASDPGLPETRRSGPSPNVWLAFALVFVGLIALIALGSSLPPGHTVRILAVVFV